MEKKLISVYKATNKLFPNKHYIGYDSGWHNKKNRKYNHEWCSFSKQSEQYYYSFHKAIREFGKEQFNWEIIYETLSPEVAKYMEKYFILDWNSHYKKGNGYNMTDGGDGTFGHIPSEETRKKISIATIGKNLGKLHTFEQNQKHSLWMMGSSNPMYGKPNINNAKYYTFIDPKGISHQVYNAKSFCKIYNLNPGCIYQVAKGKLKQHKEWKCLYG